MRRSGVVAVLTALAMILVACSRDVGTTGGATAATPLERGLARLEQRPVALHGRIDVGPVDDRSNLGFEAEVDLRARVGWASSMLVTSTGSGTIDVRVVGGAIYFSDPESLGALGITTPWARAEAIDIIWGVVDPTGLTAVIDALRAAPDVTTTEHGGPTGVTKLRATIPGTSVLALLSYSAPTGTCASGPSPST